MTVFLADGYVTTPATTTVVGSDSTAVIPPDGAATIAIPATSPSLRQPPPPYLPAPSSGVHRPGLPTI